MKTKVALEEFNIPAIKAKIRRRMIALHKQASVYMRENYGLKNFPVPRILYLVHPEAWAYADLETNAISFNKGDFKHLWLILNEFLPHEMAHMAMYQIKNYSHDKEWKKCAIYLGSTGALTVNSPLKSHKKIYGIYTYKKEGCFLKVIGKPLSSKHKLILGATMSDKINMTYRPKKDKTTFSKEHTAIINT